MRRYNLTHPASACGVEFISAKGERRWCARKSGPQREQHRALAVLWLRSNGEVSCLGSRLVNVANQRA